MPTLSAVWGCRFIHVYNMSSFKRSGVSLFRVFSACTRPEVSPRFLANTSHSLPTELHDVSTDTTCELTLLMNAFIDILKYVKALYDTFCNTFNRKFEKIKL